jgi:hypothetical protein
VRLKENRVLRKLCGRKRVEVVEELRDFYPFAMLLGKSNEVNGQRWRFVWQT